jgi:hypothetical protein
MLWSRKPAPPPDRSRVVGLDLDAGRVRAAAVGGGAVRPVPLDGPADELALVVAGDRRSPEVGRAGVALLRKMPHATGSAFLPRLGQPVEFQAGRHALTPDAALELAFAKLRDPVLAESDAVGLLLPAYLAPAQVARAVAAATRAKLPPKGTASAPLAVAAHRAALVLNRTPPADLPDPHGRVIPIRPHPGGPGSVVVIEADAFALSATVVDLDRSSARLAAAEHWPKLGLKTWFDKLLDAVSDRCVRLCRRDPRDSADAEQALFEQLPEALDRSRAGQRVCLTVRTASWYQDVIQPAEEFDANCPGLARAAADAVRAFVADAGSVPPRAVWLSHAAGRLPGLARAVYQNTPEGTAVEVLPPSAAAHAAAALVPRWLAGDLPKTHLDATVPLAWRTRCTSATSRRAWSACGCWTCSAAPSGA